MLLVADVLRVEIRDKPEWGEPIADCGSAADGGRVGGWWFAEGYRIG